MKFLKGLALGILGFLLFLSLSTFGLAFMIKSTILNPGFMVNELNKLDVSSLTSEVLGQQVAQGDFPQEFGIATINTVTKLEPMIKEEIGAATYSIYDYLLGKKPDPELARTLRNTVLSTDFAVSLVNELDISSLAGEFIKKQLAQEVPAGTQYVDKALDDTLTDLEPWLKEQLSAAADPILDYLIGESQSLSVVIPLEPVKESLRDNLRQAFLQSPPPELAGLPQAQLEQYFNQFYQQFSGQIPATFELDERLLGTEIPAEIARALTEAETGLEQVRQFVSQFHLTYYALIGFMLLLVLLIVLIHREVKSATRSLGATFVTYGAIEYGGIFAAKHFAGTQIAQLPPVPSALQAWIPQFLGDLLAPLEMLSLGLLVGGIILLVVSFVYKRQEALD